MWLADSFLDPQIYSKGFVNNKTFFDRKLTFIDRVSQLSTWGSACADQGFFFVRGGGGGGGESTPDAQKTAWTTLLFFTQHNINGYNEMK